MAVLQQCLLPSDPKVTSPCAQGLDAAKPHPALLPVPVLQGGLVPVRTWGCLLQKQQKNNQWDFWPPSFHHQVFCCVSRSGFIVLRSLEWRTKEIFLRGLLFVLLRRFLSWDVMHLAQEASWRCLAFAAQVVELARG